MQVLPFTLQPPSSSTLPTQPAYAVSPQLTSSPLLLLSWLLQPFLLLKLPSIPLILSLYAVSLPQPLQPPTPSRSWLFPLPLVSPSTPLLPFSQPLVTVVSSLKPTRLSSSISSGHLSVSCVPLPPNQQHTYSSSQAALTLLSFSSIEQSPPPEPALYRVSSWSHVPVAEAPRPVSRSSQRLSSPLAV